MHFKSTLISWEGEWEAECGRECMYMEAYNAGVCGWGPLRWFWDNSYVII